MIYRAGVLGCGARGREHCQAYRDLDEIQLTSVCDIDEARGTRLADEFKIKKYYRSLEDMLSKEKLDILHIVTMPNVREQAMELAGQAGVKGIIVEKPLAITPAQAKRIAAVAERYGLKVALNTQRRYFGSAQKMKRILSEQKLGEMVFVHAAVRANINQMGPHVIDMIQLFMDDVMPASVYACASGVNGRSILHPGPMLLLARFKYPNRVNVYLEDCEDADCPSILRSAGSYYMHMRVDLWGNKGRAWYVQDYEWGYQVEGSPIIHREPITYQEETLPGQREFTRAMARWLDDDSKPHGNCLKRAQKQLDMITGALHSAHLRRPVELPAQAPDDLWERMEKDLDAVGLVPEQQ